MKTDNFYINYRNNTLLPANNRVSFIYNLESLSIEGTNLIFSHIESKMWQLNLQMIDSKLPEIMAEAILHQSNKKLSNWTEIVEYLTEANPIGYSTLIGNQIYEAKLKSLLTALALGMDAKNIWHGVPDSVVGITRVCKAQENRIDYAYNKFSFENYLFHNTLLSVKQLSKNNHQTHLRPQINFV